jgi:hypothetical protein
MKNVNPFISKILSTASILILSLVVQAWEIDFSRRTTETNSIASETLPWPSSQRLNDDFLSESPLKQMFTSIDVGQTISLLHTEEGFIPNTLRLKKDNAYKLYVVNVNEKFKNVSFILDSFGQSFGIYFGKTRTSKIKNNFRTRD